MRNNALLFVDNYIDYVIICCVRPIYKYSKYIGGCRMNDNEYLYHYTNIETLALILRNHTLRFNSLDKMDDLQEQETADLKNVGQFCYISSWTDDVDESIPMWNMYTSVNSGVRIRLKRNPFKLHENTAEDLCQVVNAPVTDNSNGTPFKTLIPVADMFKRKFITPGFTPENILHKVEYSADQDKLYPKLVNIDGDTFSIALGTLGKYKNTHWSFQSEWRYILLIFPLDLNQPVKTLGKAAQLMGNKLLQGLEKQPFPFYDMYIDDAAYSEMEITLSPKISAGNRIIIENLVEKYNPSAVIKDSSLIGLI